MGTNVNAATIFEKNGSFDYRKKKTNSPLFIIQNKFCLLQEHTRMFAFWSRYETFSEIKFFTLL